MLAQVLNRDFVLGVAAESEQAIRTVIANREAGLVGAPDPELDSLTAQELAEVADTLRDAAAREREQAPRQAPAPTGGEPPPPPKDDYAYVPRDPLLGGLQSAFEQHAREAALPTDTVEMLDDRRSGPLPVVTDDRLAGVTLTLDADGRRLWGRMEVAHFKPLSDPRWLKSVFSMVRRKLHGTAPFVARPGAPPPLARRARLIVVGDWGSGLPRARQVAKRIEAVLKEPGTESVQKHVIHLGDVYYGGEHEEYTENFLGPWPVAPGSDVASYTLNGNHDMYAGGQAYFDTALADPRFAAQGGGSTFRLANEHWQFLGLDTAYEDAGLHGEQADWTRRSRDEHPGRTALLSHHQLFSAYEPGARTLRRKMEGVLAEREIDAWFWGHEHRCLVYRDHERVKFATCVGHGGIPEYLVEEALTPPAGLVYEYRDRYSTGWQPWNTFGFAVVDLEDATMTVRYVNEFGDEHAPVQKV